MTLTPAELRELQILVAVERLAKRATTANIEAELNTALRRSATGKDLVDADLADRLADLEAAGHLDHEWLQAVDDRWHPVRDREWLWVLSPSGQTQLEKLRLSDGAEQ